jgi:Ser/Thr protein kinase RdoA (MazF antagonist)
MEPLPEGIAERYGLDLPAFGERLPGGVGAEVIRAGEFVVRVEHADLESVRWEHELLRFLAEEVESVVTPLSTQDGSTFDVADGRVVSVFPFVDGKELRDQRGLFRRELPTLLARLHQRAQAWRVTEQRPGMPSIRERNWDRNDWWDWGLVEKSPPLVRAFTELREWVAGVDDLCVCAIHGDFHGGNVLVGDRSIVGIVDWQLARLDWPAFELAGIVWDLSWDGKSTTIDPVLSEQIIGSYVDAGGPGEPEAVVPLMRLESLVSALFSLTRAARGQDWNREFTQLLMATLDELA